MLEQTETAVRRVASGLYTRFEKHSNEVLWGWSPIGDSWVTIIKSPNTQPGAPPEALNKFGVNTDIDIATVPMDIWSFNGVYPFSTFATAQSLELLSSSAEDAPNQTGAEAIKVSGLDGQGLLQEEIIITNGQNVVALSGTWKAVNRMYIIDNATGAAGSNVGQILCRVAGAGQVVSEIVPDRGQTQQAIYRVPSDRFISITNTQSWFRGNQTGDATVNPISIGTDCQTIRIRGELSLVLGAGATRTYRSGGLKIEALEWFSLRVTSVSRNDTVVIGEWDAVVFGDGD